MASLWAADRGRWFYAGIALTGLVAVAIGFSTTYIGPIARGSFHAPLIVHIHGLCALSWLLLLGSQALLVRGNRTRVHMLVGRLGFPLAVAIWASGIMTAAWAARRDVASQGAFAEASLAGTFDSLSFFLLFVIVAIWARKDASTHKRLMALATIALWWPAFFRWRHVFPPSDRPDILYGMLIANIPLLVAMLRDRFKYGVVHPVWLIGGCLWFVEQGIEVLAFDTLWNAPFGRLLLAVVP